MAKYCDEVNMEWPLSYLNEILKQLESSNRVCLEVNSSLELKCGFITLKARYYWIDMDNRHKYKYMMIVSNDERRNLCRKYIRLI